MPHATVPSPGLQAFILCGPGESLSTFTSNPKDLSKALMPIANRPMVWYPLDWCHRMGINHVTLITPPESHPALEAALATNPSLTSLPRKPDLLAPAHLEQTTGTGEILRLEEVQKSIISDFIILPCDLVSELDGNKLLQQWMTLNPLSSSSKKRKGALALFYPTHGLEGISNKNDETDFIATVPLPKPTVPAPQGSLRSDVESLVMLIPKDSLKDRIEEDNGVFKLRVQLTQKYGRVKLKMKHRDAHVYIFPKWVKDYAARNYKFDSISEDVLGWWAKAQWQKGLGEKLGMDDLDSQDPSSPASDDLETSHHNLHDEEDDSSPADAAHLSTTRVSPALQMQSSKIPFASRVRGTTPLLFPSQVPIPPLYAYVQPNITPSTPLIRRVDTSPSLLSISLHLARLQPNSSNPLAPEHKLHPSSTVGIQTRITLEDSLIAENVTIGTRCAIKETVIGAGCDIGNGVRLTRCLLMEGVRVGDGVVLTGCVVGRRARIEGWAARPLEAEGKVEEGKGKGKKKGDDEEDERTRLTECEVAPNFVVKNGTEAKGEKMMAELDGIDGSDYDDDDDLDDDVEVQDNVAQH